MENDRPTPRPGRPSVTIDFSVAHPARVYDYLLGGKDHYAADRQAAEQAFAGYPGGLAALRFQTRSQRGFLARAVHFLVIEWGIRQFLDIGTGIPAANNTHEVSQRVAPESRVVYVDNDPIVLVHAQALLNSTPEGATDYIDADVGDPETILRKAAATLDFTEPVAVMLLGILQLVPDEQAYDIVGTLLDAVPSGGHLAISHLARDVLQAMADAADTLSEDLPDPVFPRTRDEVARFFEGLEMVDPGVVQPHRWRAGVGDIDSGSEVPAHCGVARKP